MRRLRRLPLLVVMFMASLSICACIAVAGQMNRVDRSRTPFVVEYELAPETMEKWGVRGPTDSGAQIFASARLNHRNSGRSAFGGSVPFPRNVRVTWREGVTEGEYWTTGTVVGDHTIDVAARIPDAVFAMAGAKRNRFVKLQFRVKDSTVLFAWSVDESLEGGYAELMHDGDFRDATIKDGVMTEPGLGEVRRPL